MTVTTDTHTTETTAHDAVVDFGKLDRTLSNGPTTMLATLAAQVTEGLDAASKPDLAERWHAVKAVEATLKGMAQTAESARGIVARACDEVFVKDELVTIHGNARKRFTVSDYTVENKGKVLDALRLDPSLPQEWKDRIDAMLAQDELRTPVRKLAFAAPKKGQV